jgi:hypothetical protein
MRKPPKRMLPERARAPRDTKLRVAVSVLIATLFQNGITDKTEIRKRILYDAKQALEGDAPVFQIIDYKGQPTPMVSGAGILRLALGDIRPGQISLHEQEVLFADIERQVDSIDEAEANRLFEITSPGPKL